MAYYKHTRRAAMELPILGVASSSANAIYDAIGVRIHDLPITPEKILGALREKEGKKTE